MEYCTNGDLKKFIRSVPNYLNEKTVLDFFVQICEGLKYIHSKKSFTETSILKTSTWKVIFAWRSGTLVFPNDSARISKWLKA